MTDSFFPAWEAAERDRDIALDRLEQSAPNGWVGEATNWLRRYLESHAHYNPDRDNRDGPEPPEKRAWGIVTRRAIRDGWMKRDGFVPRTRGHATPGPVYRSMIYQSVDNVTF